MDLLETCSIVSEECVKAQELFSNPDFFKKLEKALTKANEAVQTCLGRGKIKQFFYASSDIKSIAEIDREICEALGMAMFTMVRQLGTKLNDLSEDI